MAVLVCGGAGYIGSHTVAALLERGEEVVVADNLTKGHRAALLGGTLCVGDIRDAHFLEGVFDRFKIEAVIDFAAHIEVGESMSDPLAFYDNNVGSVVGLLRAMRRAGCDKIVFSSTAAVYGQPERVPIPEDLPKEPTNAYGATKWAVEGMLGWCEGAYGIRSTCLRYFNACGAHESGRIGEDHSPESHLIPLVLQAALGKRASIAVFGNDYDTPDGTCVRDYVHVCDLADAHLRALDRLRDGGGTTAYNLGSGTGFSVREVIEIARKVTGRAIPSVDAERRAGDPAVLIASSDKIRRELVWTPHTDDIEKIIASAWKWHEAHPDGFEC